MGQMAEMSRHTHRHIIQVTKLVETAKVALSAHQSSVSPIMGHVYHVHPFEAEECMV